jgi:hypothetical protein
MAEISSTNGREYSRIVVALFSRADHSWPLGGGYLPVVARSDAISAKHEGSGMMKRDAAGRNSRPWQVR